MPSLSQGLFLAAALFLLLAGVSALSENGFAQKAITTKAVIRSSGWGPMGKSATVRFMVGDEGRQTSLRRSPFAKNVPGEELPIRVMLETNQAKGDSFFGLFGQTFSLSALGLAFVLLGLVLRKEKTDPSH
jgi:hypothetical protein